LQNAISGSDNRITEAGEILFATVGASAADRSFGKLFIEYTFTFKMPIIQRPMPTFSMVTYMYKTSSTQTLTSTVTAIVTGLTAVSPGGDGLKLALDFSSSTNLFTLPRGMYVISAWITLSNDTGAINQTANCYFWHTADGSGGSGALPRVQSIDTYVSQAAIHKTQFVEQPVITDGTKTYGLYATSNFSAGTTTIPASTSIAYAGLIIRGA
jgi:hypothetical protein